MDKDLYNYLDKNLLLDDYIDEVKFAIDNDIYFGATGDLIEKTLGNIFIWSKSIKGMGYWSDIYKNYLNHKY